MTHPSIPVPSRAARLVVAALACAVLATPTIAAIGDRSPDGVWSEAGSTALGSASIDYTFESAGSYRLYELDDLALFGILRTAPLEFTAAARPSQVILTLPTPDGGFARFRIAESPILSSRLAAQYPEITTYVAQGVDDPTHSARLARTGLGFYAVVATPNDFILVERVAGSPGGNTYLSFRKSDIEAPAGLSCTVEETSAQQILSPQAPPSGANLRTYDMAVVGTAEWTNNFGGAAGALMAVTNAITAVNVIYEREVAIRLTITCSSFGYTNAMTDPFTNPENVDGTLLNQADATLDTDCGANAYEIGHLFHRRAGAGNSWSGRAGIGTVCGADKGRAASTATMPTSANFTVDLLPHEIGHQFNANHTYNSNAGGCVERTAGSTFEIGAGTTIMSYACAGCTGEDPPGCADAYFHTHSFDQITNYREGGGTCGAQTATGNTAPSVNAGPDRTIPRGTPFALTAIGSDAEGDAVTWNWEQFDAGTAASPPLNGGASGPLFRSFPAVASASRTFPNLTDLLAGTATPFEILPTANRTLTFRATARDNRAGGGGVNYDTVVLTVAGDPFVLNYPNGGQSLNAGCTINVQWTVGGGSIAPNVNILFSQDGGVTFPTTLASSVPNDGAHEVVLPCVATAQNDARIRVEGAGNVFFDISASNFTVTPQAPVAAIKAPAQVVVDANCSVTFNVSGSVTDDCSVSQAAVGVSAQALGGTATVVPPNLVFVQNGVDEVTFSGTVTVSDLTGCPSIVRVQVVGTDGCDLDASDFTDVTVVDPIAPTVVTDATGGEVGPTCTYLLPFSASLNDNCQIDATDVVVTITNPSNNATLGTPQYIAQQVAPGHVEVSGTVLVSDLTSCPAVIRVEVGINDGCSNASNDAIEVEVIDTTPPDINVTLNRQFLWPPNHKLVDITADVTATDNCPNPSFVLTSITSNEPPDDIGDGNTEPDWTDADFGTPDVSFKLRSERMGPRNGRIYTITYTASDNCGNSGQAVVEVRVQHDQSGNAIVVQVGQADGAAGSNYLAVVVPSARVTASEGEDPMAPVDRRVGDSRRLEPASGLLVGNTAGVIAASQLARGDVDGDGLPDAIALFAVSKAEELRASSDALDGPVGLHYRNAFGETFLVPDLLALPGEDQASPLGAAVIAALGSGALAVAPIPPALVQASGPATPAAPIDGIEASLPAVTRLAGFRPNPFFRTTAVTFELARPAQVKLEVYSPAGARVRGLVELAYDPGRHAVTWDGRDDAGRRVSPGVYFVRFVADGVVNTEKALLLP